PDRRRARARRASGRRQDFTAHRRVRRLLRQQLAALPQGAEEDRMTETDDRGRTTDDGKENKGIQCRLLRHLSSVVCPPSSEKRCGRPWGRPAAADPVWGRGGVG